MRVIPDDGLAVATEAHQGPSEARTATLLTLPVSRHHSVRSVAQHAFRTLWIDEPDRAERWSRVERMDRHFGIGRPLRTISKSVLGATIREMGEMGMNEDVVLQHLDNFAALMLWADGWGLIRWGRRPNEA